MDPQGVTRQDRSGITKDKEEHVIDYRTGDILKDESEALVNTVNCVGVMGRGIALQFKDAYPGNFKEYAAACKRGDVKPGKMFVYG